MFEKQQLAFDQFARLKVGALFMKMGTGKTRVALELVKYNRPDFLLYIAPFSTIQSVKNEVGKWGVPCPYSIYAYESIQSSTRIYANVLSEADNIGGKKFIVADESIFIKNGFAVRHKRMLELRKRFEWALILNGTPLVKDEWDLYNQMEFLSPLIIGMNRQEFITNFYTKIRYKKLGEKQKEFIKFSKVNTDALKKMIEPYVFYADLDFGLEEKTNRIWLDYLGDEYSEVKYNYLCDSFGPSERIVSMLNALNYIASTYKPKLDKVAEYTRGKQIIVYCAFLNEIDYLKEKVDCFVIDGRTKKRQEVFDEFKQSSKPLLMTYGTGAFGLNLQFCNEIVFSSLMFDFGKIEQARYRIKRIGQERPIKYTYFLVDVGVTKFILDNLWRKESLSDLVKKKIEEGFDWAKNI